MKAFKGCVNKECGGYKKIHYGKDDHYCRKCGQPLAFVCADCWTVLEDDTKRICIACQAKRTQKNTERVETAKKAGAILAGAAATAKMTVNNLESISNSTKKAVAFVNKAIKVIKK